MTTCARSAITCVACRLVSAELLLLELPDHARIAESDVGLLQIYILQRVFLNELALLRLFVCAVGVE